MPYGSALQVHRTSADAGYPKMFCYKQNDFIEVSFKAQYVVKRMALGVRTK